MLGYIEDLITAKERQGGHDLIFANDRLALSIALRYLATGESSVCCFEKSEAFEGFKFKIIFDRMISLK